ncbi:LOW QUALITY PROTEIN: structure-specific endonuclease subunit SLX4 [Aplochiton taeniatus]
MDDSDQDFVDLCSKLLKRVRKKPCDPGDQKGAEHPSSTQVTAAGNAMPSSSTPSANSDEAIALKLQQKLDKEATEAGQPSVDLQKGGLFFCQLCNRDLSHMSPGGRTQHINRCLDKSEDSASEPAPPPSVPECPICGKKFKSQKSRSAHLKRCSVDMGVSPAMLLPVQRQAAETQSGQHCQTNLPPTGGSKRKVPSELRLPARKKPRKNTPHLDDDTMVALALSSSLVEQERERERELQREMEVERLLQIRSPEGHPGPLHPQSTWKGKGRGKRKKRGAAPGPPPLLLVQEAGTALRRLQERVTALLLRTRGPSLLTPTRRPSSLSEPSAGAPLWQKSALPDGGPQCPLEFYAPELSDYISLPSQSAQTDDSAVPSLAPPGSSVQRPVRQGSPLSTVQRSSQPLSDPAASQTSYTTGNQALKDLMELADEGMTLTQWGYTTASATAAPPRDRESRAAPDLHPSGFVRSDSPEDQAELCLSGFIPDATSTDGAGLRGSTRRRAECSGAETSRDGQKTAALSRLASDLSGLLNNPQLSDVQLQVDSGEVYFAHSFMLYTRCPLLAQMVHESGFGVKEEGTPQSQRVLLGEIPGQAVYTLLQYLYTAHCPVTPSLLPHLQELASRFDLEEMRSMCTLNACGTQGESEGEAWEDDPAQESCAGAEEGQRDRAFLELLRSMWNEADDDEGQGAGGETKEVSGLEGDPSGDIRAGSDGDRNEDVVNEEEMEEIYEFAATQRKREEEKDPPCPDRSYSRLFSDSWGDYDEDPPPLSTSQSPRSHTPYPQQQRRLPPQPSASSSPTRPSTSRGGGGDTRRQPERSYSQSSASQVIDLSSSPPPGARAPSPVPRWRSDEGGRDGDDTPGPGDGNAALEAFSTGKVPSTAPGPKRESRGPRGACALRPPPSPVELIVLSDSSEETEVGGARASPPPVPPPSPGPAGHDLRSHTRIKVQLPPGPARPPRTRVQKETRGSDSGPPGAPPASPDPDEPGSADDVGQVPTSTSTSQTLSGMHRTRLFHLASPSSSLSSPPAASVFSPLAALPKDTPQTSKVSDAPPPRVSTHAAQAGSAVARQTLESGWPDRGGSPPSDDVNSADRPLEFAVPASQPRRSRPPSIAPSEGPSVSVTPHHRRAQPQSSTPLHTGPPPHPALPSASPLLRATGARGAPETVDSPGRQSPSMEPECSYSGTELSSRSKDRGPRVPITPMPSFSDMDTPDLKNKLNRYGVRPLPKRQMILKLKQIHQYTHQVVSSESRGRCTLPGSSAQARPLPKASAASSSRPVSCAQTGRFKQPVALPTVSPGKRTGEEEKESLSVQGSHTSSTAPSEDSERSNPELCLSSSNGDSDSDVTASQATSRLQDSLEAVRSFILSDPELYSKVLRYQPLVLSALQAQLKTAGIKLGTTKLLDYLDSQCITCTTAKPGRPAPSRRRARGRGRGQGRGQWRGVGGDGARGRGKKKATGTD